MENFQFYLNRTYSKYFKLLLLVVIYSFSNTTSVKISDKNYFIVETDQSTTGVSSDGATYSTPGIACNSNTATQISGAVWEDWDYNGAMNEEDITGVKGILVSLYNDCGNVVDATATDINGDYSFSSLEISTMYRIEFSIPDSLNWAKPTQTGTDSKSMVQFVQSGNCANLGIAAPMDYCDNNPILFTPCYVNGEALGGTDAGALAAFVGVAKNFSGDGFSGSDNNYTAFGEQIGATWGVAVQASTQTVFTSSVLKRHVSFGPADNTVGTTTHTTGGIYAIDYSNPASPNTSLWLDLNTLSGIATGADPHTGLNGNPNQPNNDKGAFPEVAKMALGDLDISEDGKSLYVVNLNDKTLIEIDIATKTVQQIHSIPNPGCTNSDNTIEAAYHFSNTVGTINGSAIGTTWEDGYSLAGGPQWTINTPGLDFNPTDAPSSIFTGTIIGDNLSVPINVPNGNYEVSLYFRDYNNGIGQRVFDISLEGTVVVDDFDIEASNTDKWSFLNASNDGTSNNSYSSFAFISNQQTFTISVSDGTLNINLDKEASSVQPALLFGVKVKNLDTTPNSATDYRPWAIGTNKGKVYVGAVCSGESSELRDDLSATVFELENGTFSEVLSFPLDYERGFLVRGPNDSEFPATWNTWNDDDTFANWQGFFGSSWYPLRAQPILSDIEFDNDDNMIVAFMDRTGHQIGYNDYTPNETIKEFNFSGGDVLKACKSGETWNIEGSSACAQPFSGISGPFNYWGINGGEFYGEDYALLSIDANMHDETHWGGLVFDKTTNQLINTAYDTKYIANSGGFSWYDNANGTFIKGYEVYGNVFADPTAILPLFGKANGLGDVEMLCAPAPLEIGNYVWCDSIENGIQDACERGILGMKVQLFDSNGNLVAVTETSASGNYVFNQTNVDTTGVTVGGAANNAYTGLSYDAQYFIVFGESQFTNDEFAVNGHTYAITSSPNAGSNDNLDSDVDGSILSTALNAMPAGLPFIDMTTNEQGCGDHKYDLGVTCTSCFEITELITTRSICTGASVDTLATLTTFSNPDSIAFVYFTSAQTDSSFIYTGGMGIDTVQITSASDTVRLINTTVPAFINTSASPITFYVYAIAHPAPVAATCRPYEEIQVIVNPLPTITLTDPVDVCIDGSDMSFTATPLGGIFTSTASTGFTHDGLAGSASMDVSAAGAGTYTITYAYTDGNGCNQDSTVSVTILALPTPADAPFAICSSETSTDLTANDNTILDGDVGTVSWYDGDPSTGTLIPAPTTANLNTIMDLYARVSTTAGSCTADVDVTVTITNAPSAITFTQGVATCSGTTEQNDGSITLATATDATHYGVSSLGASTYDGPTTVATATEISGTPVIQFSVPNTGGSYIVRVFNTHDGCYADATVTASAVSCVCTNPTADTPATAQGTCTGATANNDASISITNITNADIAGIVVGADYTSGVAYNADANTDVALEAVTANAVTFSGLAPGTQYTIRVFSGADDCYADFVVTSAASSCCPTQKCGTVQAIVKTGSGTN